MTMQKIWDLIREMTLEEKIDSWTGDFPYERCGAPRNPAALDVGRPHGGQKGTAGRQLGA